jgi:RNA 2',3'-cyclic 3'-phosphodiesterase
VSEATQRVFFALWPDTSIAEALATLARDVAAQSGGRPIAAANVHLTLAFLGDQSAGVVRELSASASRISIPAFDLVVDRVESWRKNAIAFAGVQALPPPLVALHGAIAGSLRAIGIEPEDRPFSAHVTLARRIETSVQRILAPPLMWRASAFALVASELSAVGARYRVLSSWPLAANA